jgi:hypothetical protein
VGRLLHLLDRGRRDVLLGGDLFDQFVVPGGPSARGVGCVRVVPFARVRRGLPGVEHFRQPPRQRLPAGARLPADRDERPHHRPARRVLLVFHFGPDRRQHRPDVRVEREVQLHGRRSLR